MLQRLIIVGAGGHGRAVAEALSLGGQYEVVGFVDDGAAEQAICGKPLLGAVSSLAELRDRADSVVIAIGRNSIRARLSEGASGMGYELPVIVHPRAFVSPSAHLGVGTVVMAGAQIGTEAVLGRGVIVNTSGVVDHHCVVEDFGHVGTNACMAGGSILGRGAWMQAGASLGYSVRVPPEDVLDVGESRQPPPR